MKISIGSAVEIYNHSSLNKLAKRILTKKEAKKAAKKIFPIIVSSQNSCLIVTEIEIFLIDKTDEVSFRVVSLLKGKKWPLTKYVY